jgi:hypothetical protein
MPRRVTPDRAGLSGAARPEQRAELASESKDEIHGCCVLRMRGQDRPSAQDAQLTTRFARKMKPNPVICSLLLEESKRDSI